VVNNNNLHRDRQKGQVPDVLIADNDSRSVRLLLEILARRNIHADLAEDYKRASSFLDNNRYNLIFTAETISSQQDGFALLAKAREIAPELPVIMIARPQVAGQENHHRLVAAAVKRRLRPTQLQGSLQHSRHKPQTSCDHQSGQKNSSHLRARSGNR